MITPDLQRYINTLPRPLITALASDDTKEHVRTVADTYNLSPSQRLAIESELLLVAFALVPKDQLQNNIWRGLGCDLETAHHITRDVEQAALEPLAHLIPHTAADGARDDAPSKTRASSAALAAQLSQGTINKHREHRRPSEPESGGAQDQPTKPHGVPVEDDDKPITLDENGERVSGEETYPEGSDPYREPFL